MKILIGVLFLLAALSVQGTNFVDSCTEKGYEQSYCESFL